MNNIKKIYAISLFFILGIFMISSPSLRIYAADEQGSSSSDGGGDSGGDSGGSSDSGGDSNDGGGDSGDGGKDKQESSSSNEESNDSPKEDKPEVSDEPKEETKNPEDLKGTPEEQEKAAVEDYVNEEPGIKKPYPPVTDKPKWGTGNGIHPNPWKGEGGNWCKQHPDKCDGHDGHGDGKGGHGGSGHGGHNDWCSHHNCHHHNHHSNTHFSDNHNGDVTVKVHVTDYKSNDLSDVHLIIGDVYEKNLDLSSEPDTIKVDNLDIDGGDDFAVCLANEDSDEGDCQVAHADNDHDTVEVNLKVL